MVEPKTVLLSAPRTGSTMITQQLARHPQAYFIGAMFSVKGWNGAGPGYRPLKDGLGPEWDDQQYRVANRQELMDRLFGLDVAPCIGFKHHLTNDKTITETILRDDSIAKIVLTRPNLLASYSSDRLVKLKKAAAGDASQETAGVTFDADDFSLYLLRRRRVLDTWQPLIDEHRDRCFSITYTEARSDEGMARAMDFLGIERATLARTTQKRNSDRVVERFTNGEDVLAYLRAEGLEDWAEERIEVPALA